MCDLGYLYANFSLPRPLCSRLRPDVRDRQTSDVRHASSLNAPYPRGGGIIIDKFQYSLVLFAVCSPDNVTCRHLVNGIIFNQSVRLQTAVTRIRKLRM